MKAEIYARLADDGTPINEGWVYYDGEGYFATEREAEDWAYNEAGYESLEAAEMDDAIYWTQWEDEMDYQYIVIDGYIYEMEITGRA